MLKRTIISLSLMLAVAVYASAGPSYDKIFKGKTVKTVKGLMTLKLCEGKVYAEIPDSLMGRGLIMATVIERTSDIGEGASGQVSDNCVPIVFSLKDSTLQISIPREDKIINDSGDENIDEAISESSLDGIWQQYELISGGPEGVVTADMTDFFMTHYTNLYTFPMKAYNSVGGQVKRVHRLVREKSSIEDIYAEDDIVSLTGEFFYNMDGYVMGMMQISGDFSVRAIVRKMIFRDDSTPLKKIPAYPGSGVYTKKTSVINSTYGVIESEKEVVRLDIQQDKPLVFYMSDLIPDTWKPFVKEGVTIWNKSFEKLGFKDVLQVKEMPADSISTSPFISRIIYAPSGMDEVEVTSLKNPYTGEVLSSSITLNDGVIKKWSRQLIQQTASSDEKVRGNHIPDSIAGCLVKLMVMRSVAECLGIRPNPAASASYPTDSLKSASFTQRHGIVASVTEKPVFNYIANEKDVRNGAVTIQHKPGPYDDYMVSLLYGPDSLRTREKMEEYGNDPMKKFSSERTDFIVYDGDLGDDIFRSMDYWTTNQKKLFANVFDWYGNRTEDMSFISELLQSSADIYARQVVRLTQLAGGFKSDRKGGLEPLSADFQSKAVHKAIESLYDMDWFNSIPSGKLPYGTIEFISEVYRTNIFNTLLNRYDKVKFAAQRAEKDAYTTNDFLKDIEYELFRSKKTNGGLSSIQMVWQDAYLSFVIKNSKSEAVCYNRLSSLRTHIASLEQRSSGETKSHYQYLLYKIDVENKNR